MVRKVRTVVRQQEIRRRQRIGSADCHKSPKIPDRREAKNPHEDTEDLAALNDRLMAKNHALAEALSRAGQGTDQGEVTARPAGELLLTFATMVKVDSTRTDEDGIQHVSAEVISGTRRMVVPVASNVNAARLTAGATVMRQREARAGRAARR